MLHACDGFHVDINRLPNPNPWDAIDIHSKEKVVQIGLCLNETEGCTNRIVVVMPFSISR